MLQLVHVVSPYVVAALTPLLHGPSDDDDDKMNFHIFLLQREKKKMLFYLCLQCRQAARRGDFI